MFRTRKNTEQISKKKYLIFNSNESSTDECSNQKNSIYHINKKQSSNIKILKNKFSTQNISSNNSSEKRKNELNQDCYIKEIINSDDENNQRSREKFIILINNKLNNENDLYFEKKKVVNNELIQKNHLKRNNNKTVCLIGGFFKKNFIKKSKRKNVNNLNKLILKDNEYINNFFTPKNTDRQFKRVWLNMQGFSKNSEKNNFKSISLSQYKIKDKSQLKQEKIGNIIKIIKHSNTPSINSNLSYHDKNNNFKTLVSNKIVGDGNKRIYTLQDNYNFNIINKKSTKSKKKLILKFYNSNKQRHLDINEANERNNSDFFDNDGSKINSIENYDKYKSFIKDKFYRNIKNETNFFNISTDLTIKNKINKNKFIKLQIRQKTFDSSLRFINKKLNEKDSINDKYTVINEKNYKMKLNKIQNRMSSLIGKLINYIEVLKQEK